jgi:hypothetical protein
MVGCVALLILVGVLTGGGKRSAPVYSPEAEGWRQKARTQEYIRTMEESDPKKKQARIELEDAERSGNPKRVQKAREKHMDAWNRIMTDADLKMLNNAAKGP